MIDYRKTRSERLSAGRSSRSVLALCLLLAILAPRGAGAHVEESMPDPVKEMEYRILLEFEPSNLEVRNKLGMILLRRQKLDEAAAEFRIVLAAKPDDFNALDAMGLVMAEKKRYDDAIDYFRRAIALNDKDTMVHFHLGETLEKKGAVGEAESAYATALGNAKNTADDPHALENIKKIEEALQAVRARTEEKPTIQGKENK